MKISKNFVGYKTFSYRPLFHTLYMDRIFFISFTSWWLFLSFFSKSEYFLNFAPVKQKIVSRKWASRIGLQTEIKNILFLIQGQGLVQWVGISFLVYLCLQLWKTFSFVRWSQSWPLFCSWSPSPWRSDPPPGNGPPPPWKITKILAKTFCEGYQTVAIANIVKIIKKQFREFFQFC